MNKVENAERDRHELAEAERRAVIATVELQSKLRATKEVRCVVPSSRRLFGCSRLRTAGPGNGTKP